MHQRICMLACLRSFNSRLGRSPVRVFRHFSRTSRASVALALARCWDIAGELYDAAYMRVDVAVILLACCWRILITVTKSKKNCVGLFAVKMLQPR
jgi:hypothetical protein